MPKRPGPVILRTTPHYVDVGIDMAMPLSEWRLKLDEWSDKYGPDAVLQFDAGPGTDVMTQIVPPKAKAPAPQETTLNATEAALLRDGLDFTGSATRSAQFFGRHPGFHFSSLYNAREQAWQAARAFSELCGMFRARKEEPKK